MGGAFSSNKKLNFLKEEEINKIATQKNQTLEAFFDKFKDNTGSISEKDFEKICESKILKLLSITEDTLQELQNLPNCDQSRLERLSLNFLDDVYYIQTNLKQINLESETATTANQIEGVSVNKLNSNIMAKKVDVIKAISFLKESASDEKER